MYLKHKTSGDLVEVVELDRLFDPFAGDVRVRSHAGEELQEPAPVRKAELLFPSDEILPRCWTDPHYRDRGFA